ncbi:hypothetical protein HK405_013824 [Cladochytrium tenue]|nr:hypothetical protein HK405_013824 [Cladochytrium tenue]
MQRPTRHRRRIAAAAAAAVILGAATAAQVAAQACGPDASSQICSQSAPCWCVPSSASEYYVCGLDSQHCAIACASEYSYNNASSESASCYSQRPSIGQHCVSGYYAFDADTWVINLDAFDGNYRTADWVVDVAGLENGNVKFGENGGVMLSLTQNPTNSSAAGTGARLSSTSYLMYGTYKARMRSSGIPGVVTAFIAFSDVRDEIDWEITGADNKDAQTNFFYRGIVNRTNSQGIELTYDTSTQYTDLQVDWSEDSIVWSVDGSVVRTLLKTDTCSGGVCQFPSTPSRIQLAIWDGSAGSSGTRDWAGGYVPWSETTPAVGFNITFEYVSIQCAGDDAPTGPPARLTGYSAPSLLEPAISVVVQGLSGYSSVDMTRNQSVYAAAPANVTVNISSDAAAAYGPGWQVTRRAAAAASAGFSLLLAAAVALALA